MLIGVAPAMSWPRFPFRLISYSADGIRDKNNDAHVAGFTALAKSSDSVH